MSELVELERRTYARQVNNASAFSELVGSGRGALRAPMFVPALASRPCPSQRAAVSMAKAMIAKPNRSLRQARTASIVAAACALTALVPASAQATGTKTKKLLGINIPASIKVHTVTATAPATSVPASTTPPSATTSTTAPTGAAQPGTVAPPTTTPAGAATQTANTATSALPTTTTPATGSTTVIVAHKKASAKGLSAGALALAILGALLVLGCIVWALGRWLALEPRWAISLTHSLREASYRASETWAEFSDWARLGH